MQDEKDKLQDEKGKLQYEKDTLQESLKKRDSEIQELKKTIHLNNYNGGASISLGNDVNNGVNLNNTDASGYTHTSLGNGVNNLTNNLLLLYSIIWN